MIHVIQKSVLNLLLILIKKIDIDQMASYENLSTTDGSYSYQELNSIKKKILSKLESNECKAQYESNSSSITTVTKLGTSLLIAVLLLFFFLLNNTLIK